MKNLIRALTDLKGIAGREDEVINRIYYEVEGYADHIEVDHNGNIIVEISGCIPEKKLMVFAHTDEVGLMIRKIEEDGFIRFERIGGVNRVVLPGSRVCLKSKSGEYHGAVGVKSHHFMHSEDKSVIREISEQYIDFGFVSKEEVKAAGIKVGDYITFENEFIELPNRRIMGKALDDRAACAMLVEWIKEIKGLQLDWTIVVVFSVQEEFNIRGIMPALKRVHPSAVIGVDITPSCDTPDLQGFSEVVLGGGPAITRMNFHGRGTLAGLIPDMKLVEFIEEAAMKAGISLQDEVALGVITETAFIEIEGYPVANLSIPTRYTHTANEMMELSDLEALYKLLTKIVKNLDENSLFGKSIR